MVSVELAALFARDLTRLIEELRAFPDRNALWATTAGISNSAGNLALHLEGNLREYVGRQLGAVAYTRERPLEFSQTGLDAASLVLRIEHVRELVTRVIESLTPKALDAVYPEDVLGVPLSTRQFLVHLYGHLGYHLGQIDYVRRATTGAGAIVLSGL